jgi:steroid 5-alpha reductase family enzyme
MDDNEPSRAAMRKGSPQPEAERAAVKKTGRNTGAALALIVFVAAGIAAAGSRGGADAGGVPVFALAVGLVFVIQWLAFVPAYLFRTERFYDLTGSVTYMAVSMLALLLGPARDGRAILLLVLVVVWAARLGTYLFGRIRRAGRDARFDAIRSSFTRFLLAWTVQALWVSLTVATALAAMTTTVRKGLDAFAVFGSLVWAAGLAIETTSDAEKRRFRADRMNEGRFITTGLWAWSRHPNYFGEMLLWMGVAVVALPVLRGWQLATLVSPLFVIVLLTWVSGVPLLERKADQLWGGQEDYEAYKARTPLLVPRPRRRRPA